MKSQCERVRARLEEYALGDETGRAQMAAHIESCAACGHELERVRGQLRRLAADAHADARLSPAFRARFWSEVERRKRRWSWFGLPHWVRLTVPVATLMVVLFSWLAVRRAPEAPSVRLRRTPPQATHQPVQVPVAPPEAAVEVAAPPVPSAPTATPEAVDEEILENLDFALYLQYSEMIEQAETNGAAENVVLPVETES
ncbi:MAG: hypothetical protein AB1714_28170 [Acidobacteriota bacterium]